MATHSSSPAVRRLPEWDHDRLIGLAEEHGTPLYVIDLGRVRANYRRFAAAFHEAEIKYAAKAHTGAAVLSTLLDIGVDIECAAAGELGRAIRAGSDPNALQYTAVNPPDADLDYAVELAADNPGLTITAGARDTFDRLAARGYDGRVAIRINPGIGTGHHEKVATGKDAKFGIPYEDVPGVAESVRSRFDLVGIHAHVGSGVLQADLADHCRALGVVAEMARTVGDLEFVDFGGGFGVPYREDEQPLDMAAVGEKVWSAVQPLDARVVLEPGRYIVADAGCLLTEVNTVKEAPSTTVVGVDASLATMIRPAMFDAYHPIRNVSAPRREARSVSVGGPCCTSADVFCTDRPLASPRRGDLLAIGNVGAYGYELASNFHSMPRPAEVALDGSETRIARRRETFEDLVRLEVE